MKKMRLAIHRASHGTLMVLLNDHDHEKEDDDIVDIDDDEHADVDADDIYDIDDYADHKIARTMNSNAGEALGLAGGNCRCYR